MPAMPEVLLDGAPALGVGGGCVVCTAHAAPPRASSPSAHHCRFSILTRGIQDT
jgi:hypothetical protein